MKKGFFLTAFFSVFLVVLFISSSSAISTKITLLPDRPIPYFLFVIVPENVELFFTFDQMDKLSKISEIAEKRSIELELLVEKNADERVSLGVAESKETALRQITLLIDKGFVNSEEARLILFKKLERIADGEKGLPRGFVPLPIVLPSPRLNPPVCGGIIGLSCVDGFTCSKGVNGGEEGVCVPVNSRTEEMREKIFCTMIYDPVCGEDGKTYPSRCVASQRGVNEIIHEGECKDEEKKFVDPGTLTCGSDSECWNKFSSCYNKCFDGVCGEILTFAKLPDFPDCKATKPLPIPLPVKPVNPSPKPNDKALCEASNGIFTSEDVCVCPSDSVGYKEGFGCDYKDGLGPNPTPLPEPLPIKPINPPCDSHEMCQKSLGSCNARCVDETCTVINRPVATGNYPDCQARITRF